MLLPRRFAVRVIVNQRLQLPLSYCNQMAPITRSNRTSTSENAVNKASPKSKVAKKIAPPPVKPPRSTDVNKPKATASAHDTGKDGLPILAFPSANDLEMWVRTNHTTNTTGLWVKIAKKSSGIPTVTYEELIDIVLCYGWIDGQRCGLDETWFLQRITPRRSKSVWSQINREKVKRLIRMGKMQTSGQRLIDEAKGDGRWDNAYKPSSGCVVPDELAAAVEESSPKTIESFRTLSKPDKLILISRIERTVSLEDRSECIKSIVAMLERGEGVTESV